MAVVRPFSSIGYVWLQELKLNEICIDFVSFNLSDNYVTFR